VFAGKEAAPWPAAKLNRVARLGLQPESGVSKLIIGAKELLLPRGFGVVVLIWLGDSAAVKLIRLSGSAGAKLIRLSGSAAVILMRLTGSVPVKLSLL
jgi:hypothetical protein